MGDHWAGGTGQPSFALPHVETAPAAADPEQMDCALAPAHGTACSHPALKQGRLLVLRRISSEKGVKRSSAGCEDCAVSLNCGMEWERGGMKGMGSNVSR